MASNPYFLTIEKALNAYYEAGTWKAMLVTSGYTPDFDLHDFRDDAVANEVANGNGYTTGGETLAAPAVTFNTATNLFEVNFPQVVWNSASFSANGCIYYKELGTDAQDELAFFNDFGGTVTATNAAFTVNASYFRIDFPD